MRFGVFLHWRTVFKGSFLVHATTATKLTLDKCFTTFYDRKVKQFFNAAELAKLLEVDRATITRWIKKGVLKAERIGGSRWRIPVSAYEKLIKERK
jgi:excisionase family DNA binding protein